MYPLEAVLIGCGEAESSAFRQLLGNLAIRIDSQFGNAQSAIEDRQKREGKKSVFLVRVNTASDLDPIRRLLRAFPGSPILAMMNADSDSQALLSTQRAGAAQTVLVPLVPDDLQTALDTIALQFGQTSNASKTLAVLGVTEGAGATSLAINLAHEIAQNHGRRCILTELTTGMGRLATYLDLEPVRTTHDLFDESVELDVPLVQQALVELVQGLHLLAGPYRVPSGAIPSPARALRLLGHLRRLAEVLVIDMSYEFGRGILGHLTNADHILLVGQQSVPSLHDLKLVNEAIHEEGGSAVCHLVIDHFDPTDEQFTLKRLQEVFPEQRLWSVANDIPAFKAAMNEGKVLRQQAPHSRALRDIDALTRALLDVNDPLSPAPIFGWFSGLWH